MKKWFLVFLLLIPCPMWATDYYVSTSGSGTTCSSGSPCTISTGAGMLAACDRLILKDGSYDYQFYNNIPSGSSAGCPTVIMGENHLGATIKPLSPVYPEGVIEWFDIGR